MYLAMCVLGKRRNIWEDPVVCVCNVVCCAQYMVGIIESPILYKCLLV